MLTVFARLTGQQAPGFRLSSLASAGFTGIQDHAHIFYFSAGDLNSSLHGFAAVILTH